MFRVESRDKSRLPDRLFCATVPIQYLRVGPHLTLENRGPLRPQELTVSQAKSFLHLVAGTTSGLCPAFKDFQTLRGYMCGPR